MKSVLAAAVLVYTVSQYVAGAGVNVGISIITVNLPAAVTAFCKVSVTVSVCAGRCCA